jgi:hypothetical protein
MQRYCRTLRGSAPPAPGRSGMTLWNRLRRVAGAGVWDQLHRVLLGKLRAEDRSSLFPRAMVDFRGCYAPPGWVYGGTI